MASGDNSPGSSLGPPFQLSSASAKLVSLFRRMSSNRGRHGTLRPDQWTSQAKPEDAITRGSGSAHDSGNLSLEVSESSSLIGSATVPHDLSNFRPRFTFRRQNSAPSGLTDTIHPHNTPGSDNEPEVASGHEIIRQAATLSPSQNQIQNSPLRRAGLLQTRSYHPSPAAILTSATHPNGQHIMPHSQDTIRLNTVQLSDIVLHPSATHKGSPGQGLSTSLRERDSFIFPGGRTPTEGGAPTSSSLQSKASTSTVLASQGHLQIPHTPSPRSSLASVDLSSSVASLASTASSQQTGSSISASSSSTEAGMVTPRPSNTHPGIVRPSGLSLLLAQRQQQERDGTEVVIIEEPNSATSLASVATTLTPHPSFLTPGALKCATDPNPVIIPDERQPLLPTSDSNARPYIPTSHPSNHSPSPSKSSSKGQFFRANQFITRKAKELVNPDNIKIGIKSLPAVLLGSLLNILDGVSYGMIIFPATGVFAEHQMGPVGVSMFFVSCIVSQLTYSFGGSSFAGANGSMMIEVVPFFHILATSITSEIGEDHPREVIATTLVAYALSSMLTGISFFLLGALKLGVVIGFFPRHILVGCIGGVGAFLIKTGLTVSTRIDDDDFAFDWETFRFMFLNSHNLLLWTIPFGLAVLLRVITHKYHHQLVFPMYFLVIPMFFYIIVAAAQLDLGMLRRKGWLFDMGRDTHQVAWYKFYTFFDLEAIRFGSLWSTLPTQFALLFFNILHPPLNVPALSVSLNEDVDTDRELVGHGYSNLFAGLLGTVPNYLVYVNTLLFYRVGGETRIAGFLLAAATAILLFLGTGPIAFIPVLVVGALIFVLGIDLVKEALWDTRHRVSRTEYITIISIMVCMTVWDFVIGVLFGIVMSCFFFVVQNSRRRSIRAFHTGETAMSTVRRPGSHRAYIREVSKQTTVFRLQGFLFFGTIVYVEECIRNVFEGPSWQRNPVRFLVLDLSLVAGVDMSAAEAFVRVYRLLSSRHVIMVFCGFDADSSVGRALQSVELLGTEGVELFSTFNDAMEWTENAYLRTWFRSQKAETSIYSVLPGRRDIEIAYAQSLASSPRLSVLQDVGSRTIAHELHPPLDSGHTSEPYNTLMKAFSPYGDVTAEQFHPLFDFLERLSVPEGFILWKQNDPPDGLYIIESGVLRATYHFAEPSNSIEECMVAGTLAGELSALSNSPRNATILVERSAVLWKLSMENLQRLGAELPYLSRMFTQLVLKAAKDDYDVLLAALATRQ